MNTWRIERNDKYYTVKLKKKVKKYGFLFICESILIPEQKHSHARQKSQTDSVQTTDECI